MLYAMIMAGGAGTRFWPASRKQTPKQLLKLAGERSMIQSTVDRLSGLCPAENLMIVTNQILVDPIAQQLPNIPKSSIIGEPAKRDTAPCIGLAAAWVAAKDPDATIQRASLPSASNRPIPLKCLVTLRVQAVRFKDQNSLHSK